MPQKAGREAPYLAAAGRRGGLGPQRHRFAQLQEENITPVQYSRDLAKDALVYRLVRDGETTDQRLQDIWLGIATLRAQAGYALLLAAQRKLAEDAQRRISGALFSLIIRHNIVCNRDRSRFEATVFAAAKALNDGQGEERALGLLRELSPPDDEFRQTFANLAFPRSMHGVAQVVLRGLEYQLRLTEETIIAPPEKVHLEHVYPQKPPSESRWTNHAAYVSRLGNLTLLDHRLNEEARNSDFATKRQTYYPDSEIRLTARLVPLASWSATQVDERQTELCELAVQAWPHNLVS